MTLMRNKGILLLTALAVSCSVSAADVRVSPGPLALEKARDQVRALIAENGGKPPREGISVILADGDYALSAPLKLSAADSGTKESPIVWRAANRGKAVVTGALSVRAVSVDWSAQPASLIPEKARAHVRCWQLPDGAPLPGFYAGGCCARPDLEDDAVCVFSGGARAVPARWPNGRFARTGRPVGEEKEAKTSFGKAVKRNDAGVFRLKGAPLAAWAKEPDLWAYGMYGVEWSDISSPVLKADPVAGTLAVEPSKNKYGFGQNMPFFVFNAFCELDEEGEWAIDRKARRLYLWGRDDAPPLVAGADTLVAGEKVQHVVFDGIVFEVARGTAISFQKPESVGIRSSCVRRTGGNGILLKDAHACRVEGCDLYDLGKAGVYIDHARKVTFERGENVVDNCHIHHYGRIIPNYNPGIALLGCGNRATHNLIHHSPHQGIYFNGNDHYIGFNVCHDCCSFTDDAGTIYCCMRDWAMRGTVIEYNAIHMTGKQPLAKHVNGIYLDDWSSGMTLRGNIINRAPKGIYVGGGNSNIMTKNVLINAPVAICVGTRGLDSFAKATTALGAKSFVYKLYLKEKKKWSAEAWQSRYPHLAELESLPPVEAHNANFNELSNNVCVATHGMRLENKAAIESRTLVKDNLELDGDPGFVDYAGFDWELKPDSPARKTLGGGTRFAEMGLYADAKRFSPAVKHGADMTPPRPFGVELEPAQPALWVAIAKGGGKRVKQGYFRCGEAMADWTEYEFTFVATDTGKARFNLSNKPGCAKSEYQGVLLNGQSLKGDGENFFANLTKGTEYTVTVIARAAPQR